LQGASAVIGHSQQEVEELVPVVYSHRVVLQE